MCNICHTKCFSDSRAKRETSREKQQQQQQQGLFEL